MKIDIDKYNKLINEDCKLSFIVENDTGKLKIVLESNNYIIQRYISFLEVEYASLDVVEYHIKVMYNELLEDVGGLK